MALLMVSLGMFNALASSTALRSLAFPFTSPPPTLAATVSSLISLENALPRLASMAPFLCLIECHLECPDIVDQIAPLLNSVKLLDPMQREFNTFRARLHLHGGTPLLWRVRGRQMSSRMLGSYVADDYRLGSGRCAGDYFD